MAYGGRGDWCGWVVSFVASVVLDLGGDASPPFGIPAAKFDPGEEVVGLYGLEDLLLVGNAVIAGHDVFSFGLAVQTLKYQPLVAGKDKGMIGDMLGFGA